MSDPPLPDIEAQEPISRFLLSGRFFNVNAGIVRPPAFKPTNPKEDQPERQTSVYRTEGWAEGEIWIIGDQYVTQLHRDRLPVLARADLEAEDILTVDLRIVPDPIPHPRHANIVNWPDDQEKRQLKVVLLANKARLVVRS